MTRSAYGLSADEGPPWHRFAACRGADPDAFELSGRLSPSNVDALRLCAACPVREQCRDDMLGVAPRSIIAGGWRWDHDGRPVPDPRDVHMLPDGAVPARRDTSGRGGYRPGDRAHAQRWIAAGRALNADIPVDEVCARFGMTRSRVYAARLVVRELPDLADAVVSGLVTITAATARARAATRQRRASRNRTRRTGG